MSESQYQIPLQRTANLPVTEGIHQFKIISFDEGEGDKGPYWAFHCQCMTPGEEGKNTVRLFVSLSPAARWRAEIFLDAIGAPDSKGTVGPEKFVGRMFRGNVTHGDYQGRKQAQIEEMWPVAPSKTVAPTEASLATGAVLNKAATVVAKAKAAAKKPVATQPTLPDDVVGEQGDTSGF